MKITITRNHPEVFQESARLVAEKFIKAQCVEALTLALIEGVEHFVLEGEEESKRGHSIKVVLKGSHEVIKLEVKTNEKNHCNH